MQSPVQKEGGREGTKKGRKEEERKRERWREGSREEEMKKGKGGKKEGKKEEERERGASSVRAKVWIRETRGQVPEHKTSPPCRGSDTPPLLHHPRSSS